LVLDSEAINSLVYKNWFWWGLDMVADGNVLIYSSCGDITFWVIVLSLLASGCSQGNS